MTMRTYTIDRLIPPVDESDLRALARLLVDAVESGAAVSFLAPLTLERAADWWRTAISASRPGAIFLAGRDAEGIVGTVQLHPAWAPNQPHRAEIAKLLVHRRSRRAGLATRLMQTIEDEARRAGFSLLTLDTKRGEAAEHLYRRIGWTAAGTIPGYALDPDGAPHDAIILYKELNRAEESRSPWVYSQAPEHARAGQGRVMKVAFGMKAHSGWAALVVVGNDAGGDCLVVDRRRIELVDEEWARQPYHAAEDLKADAARDLVERGVESARRIAAREVRASVKREQDRGNEVAACAVLVGNPMPAWSVEEILAVHFRMHKAEGVLFRDALVRATEACGLRLVAIPERLLLNHARSALKASPGGLVKKTAALGKRVGPPWGKDQKDAALAALVALQGDTK